MKLRETKNNLNFISIYNNKEYKIYIFVFMVLLFYLTSVLSFIILLLLKIKINVFILPSSIIMSILITNYISKTFSLKIIISFILVIIFALYISYIFFDTSWDGLSYHLDAIIALSKGWNPIYEYAHISQNPDNTDLWINSFSKTHWYFSSLILNLFNNFNCAKITPLVLTIVAGTFMFNWLKTHGIYNISNILICISIAFNPILLTQWASYYLDSLIYSFFTISLLSSEKIVFSNYDESVLERWIFIISTALMATVKISGLGFAIIIISINLLFLFPLKEGKYYFYWFKTITYTTILILILGISPYLTNIIIGHNPLYPLVGQNKVDIITNQCEKVNIKELNKLHRLIASLTSIPTNILEKKNQSLHIKKLFFPQGKEKFAATDIRIAGWGPLFFEVSILSLFIFIFTFYKTRLIKIFIILLTLIILFPASWWARYSPMVYLFPILSIVIGLTSKNRFLMFLAYIGLIILIINNFIVGWSYLAENLRLSSIIKNTLIKFQDQKIDICRDPRFNLETYFYDYSITVNSIITDDCNSKEWFDLVPLLKVNPILDRESAWDGVISKLKIRNSIPNGYTTNRIYLYSLLNFQGHDKTYIFNNYKFNPFFLDSDQNIIKEKGIWSANTEQKLKLIGLPLGLDINLKVRLIIYTNNNSDLLQNINVILNGYHIAKLSVKNNETDIHLKLPKEIVKLQDPSILSFKIEHEIIESQISLISIHIYNPSPVD